MSWFKMFWKAKNITINFIKKAKTNSANIQNMLLCPAQDIVCPDRDTYLKKLKILAVPIPSEVLTGTYLYSAWDMPRPNWDQTENLKSAAQRSDIQMSRPGYAYVPIGTCI